MNLTVTFNATSVADLITQLIAALDALDIDANKAMAERTEVTVEAKPARTKQQTTAAKKNGKQLVETSPKTTQGNVFDTEPEPEPEPENVNITLPDVRQALTEFLKSHTESATQKLLMEHGGVSQLSKLDPSKYRAVYQAATTA